jgi:hypothetical protein
MRADLEPFSRTHGNIGARFGRQLFQPDRRGETSRPPPTITTSYSIDSRSCIFTHPQEGRKLSPCPAFEAKLPAATRYHALLSIFSALVFTKSEICPDIILRNSGTLTSPRSRCPQCRAVPGYSAPSPR